MISSMEKRYYRYKKDLIAELAKFGITTYTAKKNNLISQGTLTKIKRKENLSLNTAAHICQLLHCELTDLFEIIPDNSEIDA